jgi:hypothetical protein
MKNYQAAFLDFTIPDLLLHGAFTAIALLDVSQRQGERKFSAVFHAANPDIPAVLLHKAFRNGKPKTGSLGFGSLLLYGVGGVQADRSRQHVNAEFHMGRRIGEASEKHGVHAGRDEVINDIDVTGKNRKSDVDTNLFR